MMDPTSKVFPLGFQSCAGNQTQTRAKPVPSAVPTTDMQPGFGTRNETGQGRLSMKMATLCKLE